jgi:hypothetical protein
VALAMALLKLTKSNMKIHNNIRIKLAAFCSLLLLLLAFIPKADDPIDKLVTTLQQYFNNHPQEKVYLHTDKPYYLVGDTVWFKAYVTIGYKHQLSGLSGALYVDLLSEGDSVAKELKLPIISGMAVGSFVLDNDVMREGNYRIRAYTQWMRNAGPDYFYDRTFTIGNSIINNVFSKIDYLYTKDGSKTKVQAVLKYTDEKGIAYAGKNVSYQLKDGYKIINASGAKTNAQGEITINLPNSKPGELSNSYILTKLSVSASETVAKTFPIKTASLQTDVQFFPEGGNLVNGVKSKVAFKATGTNGLGVVVSGTIIDNQNKEIAQLEIKHLGMGYFYLTPQAGQTYSAKVTYPDGSVNTIKLPNAVNDGYTLSVYTTPKSDSVLVRINAAPGSLNQGGMLSLIGQSGGKVYFSANVPVSKGMTAIYLPIDEVPSGILQFTLFTSNGDPLNERIVFVQNKDNIDLKINSRKQVYNRREKVDLGIDAKDEAGRPVGGNFSISVVSETAVPSDEASENTIFSQLLLSSDIKGYIEKPNYYFYNPNAETRANLDVLMLTQGYRRFAWKNILTGNVAAPTYKAEKLVNAVTGRVTTMNHKPVPGAKVILINNKLRFVQDTVTDNDGRFSFSNLLITNGIDFTIQGMTPKGGKRVTTEVDRVTKTPLTPNNNLGDVNADIPTLIKTSVENNIKQDQELAKYGFETRAHQLREVQIMAAKAKYGAGNINESQADEVFRPDSRMPCTTLMECLNEMYKSRIRFDQIMSDDCGPLWVPLIGKERYVVLIDRVLIQPCQYQSILLGSPLDIDKVYTSHESPAVSAKLLGGLNFQRSGGGSQNIAPAVIAIFTKSGYFRRTSDPSIVYYAPKGYDYIKEFYSPKYDGETSSKVGDLRSTIYWNPRVLTGPTGQTKVSYFNSDQTGTYRVTIEGINADGALARQVYRYKVE